MRLCLIPILLLSCPLVGQTKDQLCDSIAVQNVIFTQALIDMRSNIDTMSVTLAKSKKEAAILRGIMKGYIGTIDSLARSNEELSRRVRVLEGARISPTTKPER